MDLFASIGYLLRCWKLLALGALLGGALGAAYAFLSTEWFRSEVVMLRAEQPPSLAGMGSLGGLASLAGIDIGGGGNEESMAALESREFTASFITSRNLLPVLFADEWDAARSAWKPTGDGRHPDLAEGVEYFNEKVRTISEDRRTGVITIGVQWKDRAVAAAWANELAAQINARLRSRALEDADRNVAFLRKELAGTNVVSLQQALGRLLESEMQKLMMARGREEYAFKIVDRAVPARKRFRPQRVLVTAMSLLAGAVAAAGLLLLVRSARSLRAAGPGARGD